MAHSHDSTLLARFGFADPDRREPWHDVACQYLTQPEVMAKIVALLPPRQQTGPVDRNSWGNGEASELALVEDKFHSAVGKLEVHVAKAHGYTIGFIDTVIEATFQQTYRGRKRGPKKQTPSAPGEPAWKLNWEEQPWEPHESVQRAHGAIAIEVKAHQATAGDVLRQLALYREHFWVRSPRPGEAMPLTWMLATCYPLNAREAEALTVAGVLHVQLSPDRIMAWAASRDETPYVAPEV